MRKFLLILGSLVFLFIFWIVLVFAQFPVIPNITTSYNVIGSTETLQCGVILKNTPEINVKIEAPEYFEENQQCFDLWFSSNSGKHKITVNDASQKIIYKSELKPISSYLFWDGGSQEDSYSIENYEIEKGKVYEENKYCFFRTVVNVENISDFKIKLKAKFTVDNKPNYIDTTLTIKKTHKLNWDKFRVH
jgi:hypothetical protein